MTCSYAQLYLDVIDTLSFIRERYCCSNCNKQSRMSLEKELSHFGIAHLFDSIWVADENAPKPLQMLRLAQASHQALPETWMVGDSFSIYMPQKSRV